MTAKRNWLVVCLLGLMACEVPPVDPTFISDTPAPRQSMAIAEQAVKACTHLNDRQRMYRTFRQFGFRVSEIPDVIYQGDVPLRTITAPDPRVSVLVFGSNCFVGLEDMTPEQSADLASHWIDAFEALPNSAFNNGLSDHVSGAWRTSYTVPSQDPDEDGSYHRVYIASYKTWPHGPYDPKRLTSRDIPEVFPRNRPGAAVKLTHVIE